MIISDMVTCTRKVVARGFFYFVIGRDVGKLLDRVT